MSPVTTKIRLTTSRVAPDTNQFEELLGWVLGDLSVRRSPRRLLDVGGGGSFYDFAGRLRPHVEWMVGVDPAATVLERPWLDEAYALTVEQFADDHRDRLEQDQQHFDAALCVYVIEHVEQPLEFLTSVRSLLKDGASLFGVTPNLMHYFGATSALATRVGLEDWLLRRVRAGDLIEAYHSPVRYRLNTIGTLARTAQAAGFAELEVRGLEQPGIFETYFPSRLRAAPRIYSHLINRMGLPGLCGTLMFRLGTGSVGAAGSLFSEP